MTDYLLLSIYHRIFLYFKILTRARESETEPATIKGLSGTYSCAEKKLPDSGAEIFFSAAHPCL